ncbi:MAG: hypothetical protein GX417_00045 [Clostridiales bacterium]|nr:hypothetical protein [Clostridiales bacterium]
MRKWNAYSDIKIISSSPPCQQVFLKNNRDFFRFTARKTEKTAAKRHKKRKNNEIEIYYVKKQYAILVCMRCAGRGTSCESRKLPELQKYWNIYSYIALMIGLLGKKAAIPPEIRMEVRAPRDWRAKR